MALSKKKRPNHGSSKEGKYILKAGGQKQGFVSGQKALVGKTSGSSCFRVRRGCPERTPFSAEGCPSGEDVKGSVKAVP